MRVLGIIPARGGSKRVPGKNIRPLGGQALIRYTLDAAKNSKSLDDFIVSTDDESIKIVCESAGVEIPFTRPSELAQDQTPDKPVILHALKWMEEQLGKRFDAVVLLRPTSPFKTAEMIDKAINLLKSTGADSVRTMTPVEGVAHPYWMYQKDDNEGAIPVVPGKSADTYYQSQLLPPVYRLNGVVDAFLVKNLEEEGNNLYATDMRILEIGEKESLDIDTEEDFSYCEFLMQAT